ncbi:MAG: hypothetical protein BWX73_01691 [Lentisphaerae bacterium ADurb.Bin082]|nr:MAG: hypothetical protein BWX73_01691 [Lentisphaerae bacterium ADurb.Bin082]
MESARCFRMRGMLPVAMSFSWLVPERKTRRSLAMLLTLLLAAAAQAANTWYVDASSGKGAASGLTRGDAKQSIQEAIDGAAEGDIIEVNDGFYAPITTAGKAIVIRSVNGAQKTIIDGKGVARCATLGDYGSERKTVLEGFTLQNGCADKGGGACGGTLRHCTLTNNGSSELMWHGQYFNFDCEQGGGAYDCTLSHCLVQNNNAEIGGGAYECVMDNCVLANNSAGDEDDYESRGGGAWKSVLALCVLTGNQANYGGGACDSELLSCLLTGNQAEYGGGACDSLLVNCTVTENHADSSGGIAASYKGIRDSTAFNCIIWGNSAWTAANYDEDSNLSYSCSYPWASEGDGNISRRAPIFVDAANGDFRLRTGSPGIDAGNSEIFDFFEMLGIFEEFLEVDTDLAGNPRISGAKVDMGAYEGAVDGCVISGRVQGNGILSPMTAVAAQGDSITFTATATRGAFQHFEVDGVVVSESPTYTWDNIQADGVITAVFAIVTWHVDAARPDDSGDGLSWDTAKKTIQAAIDRADDGDLILVKPGVYAPIVTDDKAIAIRSVNGAATTVIDGGGSQRCATLSKSYYGRQTVLDGFTLRNGVATASGGGLFGGTALNCRITNCFAAGDDDSERTNGGGGASCATLRNCTLSKNQASLGGAAEHCSLDNCILTANQADHFGGGASSSILSNCTVTDNAAQRGGGGVYECTVYNSIVWNNQAPKDANYDTDESSYTPTVLYYSCSDPKPQGAGNISGDPCFVDVSHGDFRLRTGSPCLDAGDNRFVQSATDLAGNPRIDNEKVDMGALEGKVEGRVISGRVQGNGTISPQTAVVAQGGSVTFTAAATGGVFQHFEVDGVVVSNSPTYTWSDIQADGMITAVFTTATWYVDAARPDNSGDGLSWETAKKSIQAALDVANDGDQVLVKAGVYEPIDGYSREVTISSISGAENTIIDGGGTRGCARAATLEGFTLQNGLAAYGGGAFDCVLNQCILSGNTAELAGGGAISSTLSNCIVVGNEAAKWGGGGAASSALSNCLLTGNASTWGGGAFGCTLRNCTVTGNSAGHSVAGVYSCTLQNCIVWDNFTGNASDNYAYSQFLYSCTSPQPAGEGNISDAPGFIDAANGVCHLRLESPCIDAGNNDFVREGDTDLAGDLRVRNETVDMGAYERDTDTFIVLGKVQGRGKISPRIASMPIGDSVTFTAEETSVRFLHFRVDGQSVSELSTYTWNNIQADGVITAVFEPAVWHVDAARPDDNGDGLSWATAKKSLQSAVVAARDGETILVKAGCYAPISTGRKSLVIRSVDGANATIIDGGGALRCATLGDDCTLLEGFTLQNGFAENGGGVSGGRLNRCIISGNTAENKGGGAYKCRLANCVLSRNYARFYNGGGAHDCQLGNCTLVGNAAGGEGGGISRCVATNCIVWDNLAASMANYNDSQFRYSCMTPLPYGDEGGDNISGNPQFVDYVNGDFRLRANSPCNDAGDSNYDSGDADLAGNPRREGPAIDMGAYEGAVAGYVISGRVQGDGALLPMTAIVPPGGSSRFEAVENGSAFLHFLVDGEIVSESSNYTWANVQADGVITAVFATNTWYVDAARPDDNGDGRTWETAKKSIQAAVEIAGKDDLILVNPGIYEPVEISTHSLVIRSAQGFEATIIDAVGKTRCATLGKVPGEAGVVLDGFTLRHGRMGEGGGAMGGALNNCLLTNNFAYHGGGAAYCTLNNCLLVGNSALYTGGAKDCTLTNCTVSKNTATEQCGGVSSCTIYNSIVWGNTAAEHENHADSVFDYSCTDPRPDGENNLGENPMFVDAANGDYRLAANSPCVNAGNDSFAVGETDLAGNSRIMDVAVDMGAFESAGAHVFKYAWQSGWNTLYLPFDSLEPATVEALAEMPIFRMSANTNVLDTPVSLHTPLWIFCFEPKFAPVLRGALTPGAPPDPLDIPVDQWTPVGAQCQVDTLPDGYAAWEWCNRRYVRVQSLQAGHVYFIYRDNAP